MNFSILEFWKWERTFGFGILTLDTGREDEMEHSLFGFCWDWEEKELQVDLFWKCFTFKF